MSEITKKDIPGILGTIVVMPFILFASGFLLACGGACLVLGIDFAFSCCNWLFDASLPTAVFPTHWNIL